MACCIPTCYESPGGLDEYCERHQRISGWYGAGDNKKGESAWRRAMLGCLMDVSLANFAIIQKLDDLMVEMQVQGVKLNERLNPVHPSPGEASGKPAGQEPKRAVKREKLVSFVGGPGAKRAFNRFLEALKLPEQPQPQPEQQHSARTE